MNSARFSLSSLHKKDTGDQHLPSATKQNEKQNNKRDAADQQHCRFCSQTTAQLDQSAGIKTHKRRDETQQPIWDVQTALCMDPQEQTSRQSDKDAKKCMHRGSSLRNHAQKQLRK